MKDESSRLAVQPVPGFQRGLCPEAAMGVKVGSAGMLELPVLRQGPKRGTQEELGLGCHMAASYPSSPLIFTAHVGFAGFLGLGSLPEPPRHLGGCGLVRLGAVKFRCRRWPRSLGRCWQGGRLFWERRGKCLAVSRAVLQAPASPFLAGREIKELHWESCCVRHRGGGLSGTGGPCTLFWSRCEGMYSPGRPGRCWQREEALSQAGDAPGRPGGKIISPSRWAETSDLWHL